MSGFSDAPPPFEPGFGQPGYGPRGRDDDHLWALLSYLLTFVAGFIAPLVVYLVKKDESPYVRFHSAQSLNMAITGLIYGFGGLVFGLVLGIATHGLALLLIVPLFIAYALAHLVFLILACIKANQGELYRVPAVVALPMVS